MTPPDSRSDAPPGSIGPRWIATLPQPEHALPVAIAAGASLLAGFGLEHLSPSPLREIGTVAIWLSLALGCVQGVPAAWRAIRRLTPNIDLLMVIGAFLAAGIGHPEEGALLLFMFTLAGALEHRALAKARDAVSRLSRLMPRNARRQAGGAWEEVEPEALSRDDLILIPPGETVPADAVVVRGTSHLDQSRITGESLPRAVEPGSTVFAGTLNQDGALEATVLRPVQESSIQRILNLVLEAQERRQPIQRLIDRVATPYAIGVMALAVVAIPLLVLLGGLSWPSACYRSITLLVVCSPCALVIAAPTATLSGLSRAARAGVLLKGGDALERLSRVRTIAVDKTGTLTTGRIAVTAAVATDDDAKDRLLAAAMAAEERSTHPIAGAIVAFARSSGLAPQRLDAVTNVPGRGVEAVSGSATLRVGSLQFCSPLIDPAHLGHLRDVADGIRGDGGMPVFVASEGQAVLLALADRPRPQAFTLVEDLRRAGVDRVVMLTGDHRQTAEHVAAMLHIGEFHAELLPEQKVQALERLRAEEQGRAAGGGLGVVGDGVNDAPVLAMADVGIAMGAIGSDAAMESADVILLNDDISLVPWSIGLSRRVRRIMAANLLFAMLVIAILAVATVLGHVALALGVIGHEGSTLLVVANALRLLGHPTWTRRDAAVEPPAHDPASAGPASDRGRPEAITASDGAGA